MIQLQQISKIYQTEDYKQTALEAVDLTIARGEFLAIMGASGSGKSTLMNILGLLDRPSSGHYYLKDQEISQLDEDSQARIRNESIGFVFQSFFLLPRMTALQNVGLPLSYRGLKPADIEAQAQAMLEKVGMARWAKHRPNQLSGGQQQRVAIARALIVNPDLILADEPTGALDSKIGQAIIELFLELNRHEQATIILVTHDQHVAQQCQRTIVLADGRILP